MVDDVVSTLIDRVPRYHDATAPDWRIVRLPQRVYPGLVPGQDEAEGRVFTDLTEAEWTTLDAFEDPAYTLATVRVLSSLDTAARAYTWRGDYFNEPWSTTDFGREELGRYLDRCRQWRQRYEQQSG